MKRLRKWARYAVLALAALVVFFYTAYRPWSLYWGATSEEINRPMPGDEVVADPNFNATRAITISVAPEDIWPWLVQIGYKRAGFYSYDFLDNDGIPSSRKILQEYQDLRVGDRIPLSKNGTITVTAMKPGSFLLLTYGEDRWTWSWGLYPAGPQKTRLVSRLRFGAEDFNVRMMLECAEIFMMRKCLLGIKERAESETDPAGMRE